jgi:hypothetical protein
LARALCAGIWLLTRPSSFMRRLARYRLSGVPAVVTIIAMLRAPAKPWLSLAQSSAPWLHRLVWAQLSVWALRWPRQWPLLLAQVQR